MCRCRSRFIPGMHSFLFPDLPFPMLLGHALPLPSSTLPLLSLALPAPLLLSLGRAVGWARSSVPRAVLPSLSAALRCAPAPLQRSRIDRP